MKRVNTWVLIICFPGIALSQLSGEQIRTFSDSALNGSIVELRNFLALANNGRIAEERDQNVSWCMSKFESLGFDTQIVTSDSIPHVFAEKWMDAELNTVLFYLQIDGQPVDASEWDQASPFIPVLKRGSGNSWEPLSDWEVADLSEQDIRIFARSSSDSKGPAMAFISALEILNSNGFQPSFNIKVILDFQEELGSPTLPGLVQSRQDLFQADLMLIMDGTRHISNLPTLTFGARGIATITLCVYGPSENLHSGQYGNYVPNPVFKLSRLLADIKDQEGRVVIPGFYDGITLSEDDKTQLNSLPEDEEELKSRLGIAAPERVGDTYQESLQYPSLNIRGLRAAWVGNEVRTIIPSEAVAEIDIRLVPETQGDRMVMLVRDFIEEKGYYLLDSMPTSQERATYSNLVSFNYRIGSLPFRTEMDSESGKWLEKAMQRIFDDQFVKMRTTGGSQPISPFITTLGLPAISIRIPNPDNNIHGPNENLRISNYLEGIQMCLSILTQPFD